MKNQPNGFKLGFDAANRTIPALVPDGTRYTAIMIRLDEIHQVKMRDYELPHDLIAERASIVEELYQIYQEHYQNFVQVHRLGEGGKGGGR